MPSVNITVPETLETVSRPIIYTILNQVKEITRIPDTTPIIFLGDMDKNIQSSATLEDTNRESKFSSKSLLKIEVEEEVNEEYLVTTAISRLENPPIFYDKSIGVMARPIYSSSKVVISIKYRSTSKTEATRWYNDNRINISNMRDINLHSIPYHYTIPEVVMDLIADSYEMKQAINGDGMEFLPYLQTFLCNKATIVSSLDGANKQFAIADTQTRIVGMFGFDPLPSKPEKEDGIETWQCTFTYTFNYDKPVGLNVIFPVMIHNQLMPNKYIDYSIDPYKLDSVPKSFSLSLGSLNQFEIEEVGSRASPINPVLRLPKVDHFIPLSRVSGTAAIFYALTVLAVDDMKTLLNLTDLDYIVLDPDFIQFFKDVEYQYLTMPYQSFFNLSIYSNAAMINYEKLVCSPDLTVSYTDDLNLSYNNRIRFSVVTDVQLLNPKAMDRLYGYSPALFGKVIKVINDALRNFPGIPDLGPASLTEDYINKVYRVLTGKNLINNSSTTNSGLNNLNAAYGNQYGKTYNGLYNSGINNPLIGQMNNNEDIGFKTVMSAGILAFRS